MSVINLIPHPASVTTSVTKIVPYRQGRQQVTIRNQGSFPVYLGFSPDITVAGGTNEGLKLDSQGLVQFSRSDGDQTEAEMYAIADGGASVCVVIA